MSASFRLIRPVHAVLQFDYPGRGRQRRGCAQVDDCFRGAGQIAGAAREGRPIPGDVADADRRREHGGRAGQA